MDVIIDSNVVFRVLITQGDIMDLLSDDRLSLISPDVLLTEFLRNREEILSKSRLSDEAFKEVSAELFSIISLVPKEEYTAFIPRAKLLLREHDKDEDFVALALSRKCKVWTYEKRIFDIGLGISTKELSGKLGEK